MINDSKEFCPNCNNDSFNYIKTETEKIIFNRNSKEWEAKHFNVYNTKITSCIECGAVINFDKSKEKGRVVLY